ncbi:MAG TPA: SRPBCC domain-containing protein [Usitatibacter sp.]|nr:SRPBCC domain-containing protein [Usitatibacter sp.]
MKPNVKTFEITLNRKIPASPAEAFDAWLDRTNPGTPWHGANKLVLDPRIDALFYFLHVWEDGTEIAHYGRFTALERPNKIRYTWMSPYTRGLESIVTVTFQKKGEDTLLTLNHANLPDDELGRMHEQGWGHYLGILEGQFVPKHAKV